MIRQFAKRLHETTTRQIQGFLGWGDDRCAMGVACDMYAEEHPLNVGSVDVGPYKDIMAIDGWRISSAPSEVLDWLEIDEDFERKIKDLNDAGHSFEEISNWILKNTSN